jgi:hypothetical protein
MAKPPRFAILARVGTAILAEEAFAMLAHTLVVGLLLALPAAPPEKQPPGNSETQTRSGQELRNAVHEALRSQATARGAQIDKAVRELSALYQELSSTTQLNPREQRELRAVVRSRLMRIGEKLQRQLNPVESPAEVPPAALAQVPANRAAAPANAPPNRAPARPNPGAAFGPGAQTAAGASAWDAMTSQNAQQLIDLIQTTIAPASWDVNGGPGTIVYFAPRQVLVVRQTGDVQDRVGAAIRGLRGN